MGWMQEVFLTDLDSLDLLAKYALDLPYSLSNGPPAVIAPDSGWGANNQADSWQGVCIFYYFISGMTNARLTLPQFAIHPNSCVDLRILR
jgi:hypothetical protein